MINSGIQSIPHRRVFIPDTFGDMADQFMVENF